MELIILGSQSGSPTRQRHTSAYALRHDDGAVWLCDVGEATQHQLLRTNIKPGRIERIFITHAHGDHCFGLPGLLTCLAVHGRQDPVQLIAPHGLAEWVQQGLGVSHSHLGYDLECIAFDPAVGDRGTCGSAWSWTAIPLPHRIASCAFWLQQTPRRGAVDPARAAALGLQRDAIGAALRQGYIAGPSGNRPLSDMLGPERPGRQLVLCGDSSDSSVLADYLSQPDLLLHECTYHSSRAAAAQQWGHSHSRQLGALAAQLQPRLLVATHFSGRYTSVDQSTKTDGQLSLDDLAAEIRHAWQAAGAGSGELVMADDRMVIPL